MAIPKQKRAKTGGRKPGTPNKAHVGGRELAEKWGPAAVQKIAQLAGLVEVRTIVPNDQGDGEIERVTYPGMAASEAVRMTALQTIVDRAYGKPTQPVGGDPDASPILHALKVTYVKPKA